MQSSSSVSDIALLRRIVPILADATGAYLNSLKAREPGKRTKRRKLDKQGAFTPIMTPDITPVTDHRSFFETIRSEFRFLDLYLDKDVSSSRTPDPWTGHKVLELVEDIDKAISSKAVERVLKTNDTSKNHDMTQFSEHASRCRSACQLYDCVTQLTVANINKNLKKNEKLMRDDMDETHKVKLTKSLRSLNSILRDSGAARQPNWHHQTPVVRQRLADVHDALSQCWARDPRSPFTSQQDDEDQTLASSHSAKLLLEGTWSAEAVGPPVFRVLMCGSGPDYVQETIVVHHSHSESSDELLIVSDGRSKIKIRDCMVDVNYRLKFQMDEKRRLWKSAQPELIPYQSNTDEISLEKLVSQQELAYREKSIIVTILANALVRLFGSKWLRETWTMDDISLFCQQNDSDEPPIINMRKPYITTSEALLQSSKKVNPSLRSQAQEDAWHQYPQILRLAILLMEIRLGDRIPKFYALNMSLKKAREMWQPTTLLALAEKLLAECKKRISPQSALIKVATACIKLNFLRLNNPVKFDDYSDPVLLQGIYWNIVWPLEADLLKDSECAIEIGQSHSLQSLLKEEPKNPLLPRSLSTSQGLADLLAEKLVRSNLVSRGNENGCESHYEDQSNYELEDMNDSGEKDKAAVKAWDDWLRSFKAMYTNLDMQANYMRRLPLTRNEVSELVKIAILDSGCKEGAHERRPETQGVRFEGWKDFVNGETQDRWVDEHETNHGTVVTDIVQQTAKFAKVFVARVFEKKEGDKGTAKHVAEAIYHAVNTWKVDIICMSFSLTGDPQGVEDAINHAVSQRVLIFGAASNGKHNKASPISFPACLGDRVICINAHRDGDQRCDFSPEAVPGRVNFAFPGQGIRTIGKDGNQAVKKGTSVATPLAAATAALVLDYSIRLKNHSMREAWVDGSNRLKDVNVMKWVMLECMTQKKISGIGQYNAVKPFLLFGGERGQKEISEALVIRVKRRNMDNILH
ncbi:Fc.00g011730.m01.CDS01 [Cosmosporella sp. VM-42]